LWNSGFKKKSYYESQAEKPGTEMEIFFSFPVVDPDIEREGGGCTKFSQIPENFKGFSIRHCHFVDCCLM
jgi:hypothetical protein